MARQHDAQTRIASDRRTRREMKTLRTMIGMHCRDHHGGGRALCVDCQQLWDYAERRVEVCPFVADKPTCLQCTVHCYSKSRRERIREVMRYAGPRMLLRHPVLTVFHVLDGRREVPELVRKQPGATAVDAVEPNSES